MYDRIIKRIFDFILSSIAILVLSPFLLLLAVLIRLDSPGPVFFRQKRIGRNKTHFMIYKYRTMRTDTPHDTPTAELKDPMQYITRTGKILRKTSLDELPQLFNIWKGEMAIVGPRPALWNQYDLSEARSRVGADSLRPGLTGWAQINGRDELSIEKKAELDGEYVRKESFLFDLKCIFGTVLSVLRHSGVVEGGTGSLNQ